MTATPSTAYEQLFQSFGLKENPFRSLPDMRFLYLGRAHETLLTEMMFGIESHQGLLVVTGEPGTGKTLLLRRLLEWLNQRKHSTAYIFHSQLNTTGLFRFIARDFGIQGEFARRGELLAAIHEWLKKRQSDGDSPVLIVDEAQALSTRALAELCLLLNLESLGSNLLQIVLAGQTELDEKLHRPELRQLRQRIAVRCRTPLLSLEETTAYIGARLQAAGVADANIFSSETLQAVYSYAQGIPRVTNLVCEKSLLLAYSERKTAVSPLHVRRAAFELDLSFTPVPEPDLRPSAPAIPALDLPSDVGVGPRVPPAELASPFTLEPVIAQPEPAPQVHGVAAATPAQTPPMHDPQPASMQLPPSVPPPKKPNVRVFAPKPAGLESRPIPSGASASNASGSVPVSAAVVPARRKPGSVFRQYWREVAQSFLRDCRYFLGAFRTQTAPDGKVLFMKKYDLRRDLVAPVSRWLSKPVHFGSNRHADSQHRRAGHGRF